MLLTRAPEVLDEDLGNISSKADMWALACTMIEMGSGSVYPAGMTGNKICTRLMTQQIGPSVPEWFPPMLQDVLRQCLIMPPADRPTASEVMQVSCKLALSSAALGDDDCSYLYASTRIETPGLFQKGHMAC